MHHKKMGWVPFALATVMSLGVSAFASAQFSGGPVGEQKPIAASQITGAGQHGFGGDLSIFVPESTSFHRKGFAHTNHLVKLLNAFGISPNSFNGYSPANIRSGYNLPSVGGSGTIVIVDAFDDPFAVQDFAEFSKQFGLQYDGSSTPNSGNNRFQVVYASGTKPPFDAGWSQEASLDIEWAHAMAPNAQIVLVEAASNSFDDLAVADDLAATISAAHQCSNSWGADEFDGDFTLDHYLHPGMIYFFSSGDDGGIQSYPAASQQVVAVGGTSLHEDSNGLRTSESAWGGAGCGQSPFVGRPAFQDGIAGIVGTARGIADVSAVADPNTGVLVRWNGGWYIFGGTSVACPIIAGITNLAHTNRGMGPDQNAKFYSGIGGPNFYDVTTGSAGGYPAMTGWDWPTGVGSPNGTAGF